MIKPHHDMIQPHLLIVLSKLVEDRIYIEQIKLLYKIFPGFLKLIPNQGSTSLFPFLSVILKSPSKTK